MSSWWDTQPPLYKLGFLDDGIRAIETDLKRLKLGSGTVQTLRRHREEMVQERLEIRDALRSARMARRTSGSNGD